MGQFVAVTSYAPPYTLVNDRPATVNGANLMTKYENDDSILQFYMEIIGLSVQNEGDIVESMKKAGARDLLNKEGDTQTLIQMILNCGVRNGSYIK